MSSVRRVAAFLLTALLLAGTAGRATATDTTLPPTTTPGASTTVPASGGATQGGGGSTGTAGEAVESWALAPVGSIDPNKPGNRPALTYQANPGDVIHDAVTLYNLGNVPLSFRLYATDAFNNTAGQFDLIPGEKAPSDVGSWLQLDATSIDLPARKQATIPITITVPADARPGDHAGGVLASSPVQSTNGSQIINLDRRTGTRLFIRVNGDLKPELDVTDLSTDYHQSVNPLGGSAHVTFKLENRGDVRLSGTPAVEVSGPFGIGRKRVTLKPLSELLPGNSVSLSADLNVPAAVLLTTKVTFAPATGIDVGASSLTKTDATFAPPITLLIILAVLLIIWVWRRQRRRRRGEAVRATSGGPGFDADLVGTGS